MPMMAIIYYKDYVVVTCQSEDYGSEQVPLGYVLLY
jgi:hypothetical protein